MGGVVPAEEVSLKPGEWYVGVVDLFAVVLPGAIFTFIAARALSLLPDGAALGVLRHLEGATAGLAFAVSAYLLGHIIFSVGSQLDDVYDWLRSDAPRDPLYEAVAALRDQHARALSEGMPVNVLAPARRGGSRPRGWLRLVAWLTRGSWSAAPRQPGGAKAAINTFNTAMGFLRLDRPMALGEVRRLEADSKFFRSVVVILLLLFFVLGGRVLLSVVAVHGMRPAAWADALSAIGSLVVLRLCFARYAEQRKKATDLAYQLLVLSVAPLTRLGREGSAQATIGVPASEHLAQDPQAVEPAESQRESAENP